MATGVVTERLEMAEVVLLEKKKKKKGKNNKYATANRFVKKNSTKTKDFFL